MATSQDGSKLNQSVQKAITLLRATAASADGTSVSALARAAGLPRATALRLIQTMESEGFLLRVPQADRVLLGPELLRLARRVDTATLLSEVAGGRLSELSDAVRETVTLSVVAPDGGLDLVDQVVGPHHLVPRSWLGQRFPLHASSSGKLLLSTYDEQRLERFLRDPLPALTPHTITTKRALRQELERICAQGHAATVDELEEGLAGVSVGIFGEPGALVGTINVSGLSQRLDQTARRRAVEHMRDVVDDIEAALQQRRSAA
ncbi:MAG TPA: IclR family transcriptional regulator [Solirubrobacteraceae bacterium]|nr:IclR family transcriptional regulator [Solirubrobacteraceae bacterium]